MRHSGIDRNGKCEFVIPLYHEFKNKSQCVELVNKFLDNCRKIAKNEDDKGAVNRFRRALDKFYDSHNDPDADAYAIHDGGYCFFMKRHTNFENWKHSFNFCRYDMFDYETNPNGLEYEFIRTEFVPEDAEYEINHDFDQEMFKKSAGSNDGIGSNKLIRGSNVYVKRIEKKEKIEKIKRMKESLKAKQHNPSSNAKSNVNGNVKNVKSKQKGKTTIIDLSKINLNPFASNQIQSNSNASNSQNNTSSQNSNVRIRTITIMCGEVPIKLNIMG